MVVVPVGSDEASTGYDICYQRCRMLLPWPDDDATMDNDVSHPVFRCVMRRSVGRFISVLVS
jgi:hypothetical protein